MLCPSVVAYSTELKFDMNPLFVCLCVVSYQVSPYSNSHTRKTSVWTVAGSKFSVHNEMKINFLLCAHFFALLHYLRKAMEDVVFKRIIITLFSELNGPTYPVARLRNEAQICWNCCTGKYLEINAGSSTLLSHRWSRFYWNHCEMRQWCWWWWSSISTEWIRYTSRQMTTNPAVQRMRLLHVSCFRYLHRIWNQKYPFQYFPINVASRLAKWLKSVVSLIRGEKR